MNFRDVEAIILDGKELKEDHEEFLKKKAKEYWESHPDVLNRFPRWKKYIAWVAGYQNFDYNRITKKLVEVPLDRQRRLIVNKLKPYVRTLHAKLMADVPQPSVIPNTSEDADIRAARIGDKVIEGLSNKLEFDRIVSDMKLWAIICNRAFLHVYWDEDAKGYLGKSNVPLNDLDTGMPKPGEELAEEPEISAEPQELDVDAEGDVRMECVSPFNCRHDPLYWDRMKWRWFLYGDEVDAEFLEEKYELEPNSLREKKDVLDNAYDLELQDESDITFGQADKIDNISGRTVVWKELWTPKIYVFFAGSKIVDYGPNAFGEIPFFAVEERVIPINSYEKEFVYNEGLIKDAIPLQREYNRQASIMSIALDRASKLKVMTPIGSVISKKQWVNDYGVFIDYNRAAGEPHQLKLDPFPMEMPAYKADLEREMQSVMSLSPASFGQLPERASHASGTLVNLLLEQDDVVLNPLLNIINTAIGKAWSLALRLVQDNYVEERILKIVGEDGLEDIVKFKGADLGGNTDVRIISQAGLPRSRGLRIEYLLRMREVGLLRDDRSTLEMLEFGNAERIFKDELVHERRAYRENRLIAENPMIDPAEVATWAYPLDDHMAHLKIHLRDRLGVKFEQYGDNQKQALETHIQQTMQFAAPMIMQGQQAQEQAGAAPGGQQQQPETAAPVQ